MPVTDFLARSANFLGSRKRAGVCERTEAVAASEGPTAGSPWRVRIITDVAASLKGARV